MKVYIIGNKDDVAGFKSATYRIKENGDVPINTIKVLDDLEGLSLSDQIAVCYELIRISDAVCYLQGIEGNFMANMERAKATKDNKDIYEL